LRLKKTGYSRSQEGTCSGGGGGFFGFGGASGRENANRVDLNRDFPKQYEDREKKGEALFQGRQPETS
jgi:murein tripeptide amidase MpaA